jgi:hypothetical protein
MVPRYDLAFRTSGAIEWPGSPTLNASHLLGPAIYDLGGLEARGLFPNIKPMTYHNFEISSTDSIGASRG